MRQVSTKLGAQPDLKARGRILLAAFSAAIPTIILLQLYVTGMGMVNLIVGGLLYFITYLTSVPILGAVSKSDIDNLETILCNHSEACTRL